MDLGGQFEVILAEDWLTQHKATLNFDQRYLLSKGQAVHVVPEGSYPNRQTCMAARGYNFCGSVQTLFTPGKQVFPDQRGG
jgi:hypothetical protein